MRRIVWIACVGAMIAWAARAAATKPQLVTAELLADVSTVKAGEPFTVGVLLRVAPGWHVYWANPGDSGQAPHVGFQLPPGFTARPIQFPVPRLLKLPGDLVNYGYQHQVMLLAQIVPPKEISVGPKISIGADVRWLCCKDVCLPGLAQPQLALTVAQQAMPANRALFEEWEAQVPEAQSPDVRASTAELAPGGEGRVMIHWKGTAPKDVELFPSPSDALQVGDVAVKTSNDQTTVTFKVSRLVGLPQPQARYELVAGYTDPLGRRRGLSINLPVNHLTAAQ